MKIEEMRKWLTLADAGDESLTLVDWVAMKPPPEKAEVASNWELENISETLERERESEECRK